MTYERPSQMTMLGPIWSQQICSMAALTLTKRPSNLQCNALSCLWVLQLVIAWWLTEKRCAPACCDRSALCQNSFLAARSWLQTRLTNFQNQDNKKRANCRIGSDTTFRTLFSVHKPLWKQTLWKRGYNNCRNFRSSEVNLSHLLHGGDIEIDLVTDK